MPKIDPSKLKAYMDQVAEEDNMAPDLEGDLDEDYLEEAGEELEEAGATGDYEGFLEQLFQNGDAIQAAASTVYLTAMDQELPAETKTEIQAALKNLPAELVAGIKAHLAELDFDDLHEMVENLEEAGVIENDASVVPFLYWAARLG